MPARIGPRKPVRVFLALWREYVGITQEVLGGRISPPVDKGTVSRWETAPAGRLTTGVVAAFAEALDRDPRDMYRMPPPKDEDALVAELERLRQQTDDVIASLRTRKIG